MKPNVWLLELKFITKLSNSKKVVYFFESKFQIFLNTWQHFYMIKPGASVKNYSCAILTLYIITLIYCFILFKIF